MLRAMILVALICVYCGTIPSLAAETHSVNRPPTTITTNVTPPATASKPDQEIDSNNNQPRYYHPAEDKQPRVLEEFNSNFVDGSYEYKYILSNGVTRYEKSYWKPVENGKILLARKGFYSHPLTNHKYLTVFYTADENGFQQDTAKYTKAVPTLPKYLDIPQLEFPHETSMIAPATTTTTRKPKTTRRKITTTRRPETTTTLLPLVKPSEFNWIY